MVVAVVAITLALRTPDPAKVSAPVAALGTPLWSARRVPQPIVDLVGDARLGTALGGAAGGNRVCFDVRQEGSAVPLATAGTELALVPASTLKLLTATGALDALGSDFRFTTRAVATAGPGADGRIDRLYLVGGGDPLLATPERIAVLARDPEYRGPGGHAPRRPRRPHRRAGRPQHPGWHRRGRPTRTTGPVRSTAGPPAPRPRSARSAR